MKHEQSEQPSGDRFMDWFAALPDKEREEALGRLRERCLALFEADYQRRCDAIAGELLADVEVNL